MEQNNYKNIKAGNDIYGKQRLELAIYLRDNILNQLDNKWFIENGTLLGAWRNGKFIVHDDDFDIAILIDSLEEIAIIYNKINNLIKNKYKIRLINTYASKIEVFDESYGKYILAGPKYNKSDFHYITVDLQFYLKKGNLYESLYYIVNNKILINEDAILPLKTINLEGELFNSPHQTTIFLENNYGSLDSNSKYNPLTEKYEI